MKVLIYLASFLLLLLAEGTGAWLKRILGIGRNGYHAPIGFAFLFSVCQLFYYPAEIFDWSMKAVVIITAIVLIASVVFVAYDLKDIFDAWFRKETLIILLAAALFIGISHFHNVMTSASEETFLAMKLSSIQAPQYQGYYYFTLAFSWFIEKLRLVIQGLPIISYGAVRIYGFGLLYVVASTMAIVDVLSSFRLRNHWFAFALGIYLLFNGNYTAWLKGSAWIGLSWSILFITLSVFNSYRYLKEENEQRKYLLIVIFGAGLACDNSFGLSGLAMLYGLMVYLFSIRKIRSLFDLFTLLIPHVLYIAVTSISVSPYIAILLVLFYLWFSFRRYKRPIRRWIARSEEYCFDHWRELFLIAVPVVLVLGSIAVFVLRKGAGLSSYLYYFSDFHEIDGVRDYIFIHSGVLEIIINLFRWGGLISLIALAREKADCSVRMLMIVLLVVFLNPLATPAISFMTGPMFFHTFHVLFNPFTETIMFVYFYRMFQWTVIGQWILEIALCFGAFIGIVGILP